MNAQRSSFLRPTLLGLALLVGATAIPASARSSVSVGVSVGVPLPHGYVEVYSGRDRYYYHRGHYYRPWRDGGYVVVRPPRGVIVREIPRNYTRVVVASGEYYRYDGIYYRRGPDGYVVVDTPVEFAPREEAVVTPAAPANTEYLSVWRDETEFFYKQGQFFKRTPEGMKWVDAPYGAISKSLPANPQSVWFQETEFFECDGAYFKKVPDGYKVVDAPWKRKG